MDKIIEKLESMDDKLDTLNIEQVKIKKDLKYHIKRTDILEEEVKPISKVYQAIKWLIPTFIIVAIFIEKIASLLGV